MSTTQIWNNIIAYAFQIGVLVGLAALIPPLFRLRTPRARLLFWQTVLVACIVLPWVQPWRQEVVTASSVSSPVAIAPAASVAPALPSRDRDGAALAVPIARTIPVAATLLFLLATGVLIRLAWLAIGLARLAGYRRRGHDLACDPVFRIATAPRARCLISDEIPSPVTFGWRDPVVLLPARFPSLRADLREAILCHELIHVERRDWMLTVAEELIRAVFWLHPAIWWVLGEIQLAREQLVDHAVVEITHACGHYVDALLAMAVAPSANSVQLDLAPAPLFLRRRHLKQRVIGLLQEVRATPFSKAHLVLAQTTAMAAIGVACWLVSGAFPLAAAPQIVADAPGVVVNTGDAKLIHRTPVAYPPWALQNGIQGRVVIQAKVDAGGEANDNTVVLCPRELCRAAEESLPHWQFDASQANSMREITIDFETPARTELTGPRLYAQAATPRAPGLMPSPTRAQTPGPEPIRFTTRTVWQDFAYVSLWPAASGVALGHTLNDIRFAGVSDSEEAQLRARMPVHAGDLWSAPMANIVTQIVAGFDQHLEVDVVNNPRFQQWSLWIGPVAPAVNNIADARPPMPPGVYMAGIGVQPPAVLRKVDPEYSETAKSLGISGSLLLSMVVGSDGTAQNIEVLSPLEPNLDQAAKDALAKWRFRPGMKGGVPVSVQAEVEMDFRVL